MERSVKAIVLSSHAREQAQRRGAHITEIVDTVRTAVWKPAELGRLECQRDFPFDQLWNDTRYRTKRVRPIFIEESQQIVIVTIYVYYF